MDDIWAIRPYVLECKGNDPFLDEWEELGQMQSADGDEFSFQDFSLDATIMEHNNEYYYIWAEKTGTGKKISNLYIAEMERPDKLATPQVLLSTPDYQWERIGFWVNEGPAVIKHDQMIYLAYSASDTGKAYCMGCCLSMDLRTYLTLIIGRKARIRFYVRMRKKGSLVRVTILL